LAALLEETGAKPRVRPERVVRSTLYDLDYHTALIACAFFETTQRGAGGSRSVMAQWLKILQFVAVRPALLPDFLRWAGARRQPDLESWQKMPRGYIGDSTHDRTIELLIAERILMRKPDSLASGERFSILQTLYENLLAKDLLRSERDTLRALAHTRANLTLLSGK
jgi:hypothetical protein